MDESNFMKISNYSSEIKTTERFKDYNNNYVTSEKIRKKTSDEQIHLRNHSHANNLSISREDEISKSEMKNNLKKIVLELTKQLKNTDLESQSETLSNIMPIFSSFLLLFFLFLHFYINYV